MFNPHVYTDPSCTSSQNYYQQTSFANGVQQVTISPEVYPYHRFVPQKPPFSPNNRPNQYYSPSTRGYQQIRIQNLDGSEKTIIARPLYQKLKNIFIEPNGMVHSVPPPMDYQSSKGFSISSQRLLNIIEEDMNDGTVEKVEHALQIVTHYLGRLLQDSDEEAVEKLIQWTAIFVDRCFEGPLNDYFDSLENSCSHQVESSLNILQGMVAAEYFEKLPERFHSLMARWVQLDQVKAKKEKTIPLIEDYANRLIKAGRISQAQVLMDKVVRVSIISQSSEQYFRLSLLMLSSVGDLSEHTAYRLANILLRLTACDLSRHQEWEELFPLTVDVIKQLLSLHQFKLSDHMGYAKLPQFILNEISNNEEYPWAKPLALKLLVGLANQQLDESKEKQLNELFSQNLECLQDLDHSIPEEKYLECIRSQPIQQRSLLLFSLLDKSLRERSLEGAFPKMMELLHLLQEEKLPLLYYSRLRKVIANYVGELAALHDDEKNQEVITNKLFEITQIPLSSLYMIQPKEHIHLVSMILDIAKKLPLDIRTTSISNWCLTIMLEHPEELDIETLQLLMTYGRKQIPINLKLATWKVMASYLNENKVDDSHSEDCIDCFSESLELLSVIPGNHISELLPDPQKIEHLLSLANRSQLIKLKHQLFTFYVKAGFHLKSKHQRDKQNHFLKEAMKYRLASEIDQITSRDLLLLKKYTLKGNKVQVAEAIEYIDRLLDVKRESHASLAPMITQFIQTLKNSKHLSLESYDFLCGTLLKAHKKIPELQPHFTASIILNALPSENAVTETAADLLQLTLKRIKNLRSFPRSYKKDIRNLLSTLIPRASLSAVISIQESLKHQLFNDKAYHSVINKYQKKVMTRIGILAAKPEVGFEKRCDALELLLPKAKFLHPDLEVLNSCIHILHQMITVDGMVNTAQRWVEDIFLYSPKLRAKQGVVKLSAQIQENFVELLAKLMVEKNNNPQIANRLFLQYFTSLINKKSSSLKFHSKVIHSLINANIYSDKTMQKNHNLMLYRYLTDVNIEGFVMNKLWGFDHFADLITFIKESGEETYIAYAYFNNLLELGSSTGALVNALDLLVKELFIHETDNFELRRFALAIELSRILKTDNISSSPVPPEANKKLPLILLILLSCSYSLSELYEKTSPETPLALKETLSVFSEAVKLLMNSSSSSAHKRAYELFENLEGDLLANSLKKTEVIFNQLLDLCDQHGLKRLNSIENSSPGIEIITKLHFERLKSFKSTHYSEHLVERSLSVLHKYTAILSSGKYDKASIWCKQMKNAISYLIELKELKTPGKHNLEMIDLEFSMLNEIMRVRRKFKNSQSTNFLITPIIIHLGQIAKRTIQNEEIIQSRLMDLFDELFEGIQSDKDLAFLMNLMFCSKKHIFSTSPSRLMKLTSKLKRPPF